MVANLAADQEEIVAGLAQLQGSGDGIGDDKKRLESASERFGERESCGPGVEDDGIALVDVAGGGLSDQLLFPRLNLEPLQKGDIKATLLRKDCIAVASLKQAALFQCIEILPNSNLANVEPFRKVLDTYFAFLL